MTTRDPLPAPIADILREALRRETFEKTRQRLVLFHGEWIGRRNAWKTRWQAALRELGFTIEALVVFAALAGVGLVLLALADAII